MSAYRVKNMVIKISFLIIISNINSFFFNLLFMIFKKYYLVFMKNILYTGDGVVLDINVPLI